MLPAASTPSNICRKEHSLTVDAIQMELVSMNEVSLGLDGWSTTNKFAMTSVIAYVISRYWEMSEPQLAFDKVDSQLFFYFES